MVDAQAYPPYGVIGFSQSIDWFLKSPVAKAQHRASRMEHVG